MLVGIEGAIVLFRATLELLQKINNNSDELSRTVFYDDMECNGEMLMEDIKIWLDDQNIGEI